MLSKCANPTCSTIFRQMSSSLLELLSEPLRYRHRSYSSFAVRHSSDEQTLYRSTETRAELPYTEQASSLQFLVLLNVALQPLLDKVATMEMALLVCLLFRSITERGNQVSHFGFSRELHGEIVHPCC